LNRLIRFNQSYKATDVAKIHCGTLTISARIGVRKSGAVVSRTMWRVFLLRGVIYWAHIFQASFDAIIRA